MPYVQRIPPEGTKGIPRWHKILEMDSARTMIPCGIKIAPYWKRQAEAPPSGEPACHRCFNWGWTR